MPLVDAGQAWQIVLEVRRGRTPDHLSIASDGAWTAECRVDQSAAQIFDLYLPLALSDRFVVAHLGQSLDGNIATAEGKSHYVTGPENITHMHRMRALCDAVIVGAMTVEADDPQLTTRLVEGANPVRAILDPGCRLGAHHQIFTDAAAPTLTICADDAVPGGRDDGSLVTVPRGPDGLLLAAVIDRLAERGLKRLFIEGGGVTVSGFLALGLLDRLQITVAPLITGSGRPGISLPSVSDLSLAIRPATRIFRMGADVLFDCDLRAS